VLSPTPRVLEALAERETTPIRNATTAAALLRRPELDYHDVRAIEAAAGGYPLDAVPSDFSVQVEVEIKYGGYVERQLGLIERSRQMEEACLPPDLDYSSIHGLSNEVREKLVAIRPRSLGQASRISGITPAALSLLAIHLRKSGFA
jgi:tRNA uridine 5-carboxymethylaminomethyl modification enzyme